MGIRIRPPARTRAENRLYPNILTDMLNESRENWVLFNNCRSRLLASELIEYRDELSRQNPDVVILNIGAVDAPNREIPKWYSDILFRRKWTFLHSLSLKLYNGFIKKYFRRPLVYLRFKTPWVKLQKFDQSVNSFVEFIRKDINAQIIILGINPGNERLEKELPGSLARYQTYNQCLKNISEKVGCHYIDTTGLESETHFPDGVHYNFEGHQWCAQQIFKTIKK